MATLTDFAGLVPKFLQLFLISIPVIGIAIADIFLKKAAADGSWALTLKSPWMAGAILLYLFQLMFLTYMFRSGKELSLVASLQIGLYALVVLGAGFFLFQESLNKLQMTGVILAMSGVLLISLK